MRNTDMFYGIGFNDRKYPTKVKSKHTREYIFWTGFLSRSCSENTKNNQPSYKPRSVSENFKSYSYFYEWCQDQIGFDLGFDLDKDLIVKGNKIYSEEFCVFLPSEINRALCKNDKGRGGLPIGVFTTKKVKNSSLELGGIQILYILALLIPKLMHLIRINLKRNPI